MHFPKRSLLSVSAVSVLLLIAFSYLFTIGVAASCVFLPWKLYEYSIRQGSTNNLSVQSLILLIVGFTVAIVLLWSLIPRRNKFSAPGIELLIREHPKLHDLIKNVTVRLGEKIPDTIYLCGEVNASVSEQGGFLGFGSRRIMSLGLPLVAALSADELGSIIAHECAHFYKGDTWLGPRVFTAESAMQRVLTNLTAESILTDALNKFNAGQLLHLLVTCLLAQYWKGFLLTVKYVSRLQEYRCDELAAYIAGPASLISGLQKIRRAQMIEMTFWQDIVYPVVRAGMLPPICESFQEFQSTPGIQATTTAIYEQVLSLVENDRYSTHPRLKERIERLQRLCGEESQPTISPLASGLFNLLELHERQLVGFLFPEVHVPGLQLANWAEIALNVHLAEWRSVVQSYTDILANFTILSLPDLVQDVSGLASRIRDPQGMLLTREQRAENARNVVWKAFAFRLVECGWTLHVRPGTIRLEKDEQAIVPGALIHSLSSGELELKEWSGFCMANGLSDINLVRT